VKRPSLRTRRGNLKAGGKPNGLGSNNPEQQAGKGGRTAPKTNIKKYPCLEGMGEKQVKGSTRKGNSHRGTIIKRSFPRLKQTKGEKMVTRPQRKKGHGRGDIF